MSLHLLEQGSTLSDSGGATDTAAGPLHLRVLVPATADQCGAVVDLRLTRPQADRVRRGASLLGMDVPAFVLACLRDDLPTRNVPGMGHSLNTLVQDPAVRRRIRKLAGYYGHKRQETYVRQLLEHELWSDEREMIVDPRTGKPAGTAKFWEQLRTLLRKHSRRIADPLDHPGFLVQYQALETAKSRYPYPEEDFRAEPDWTQARIAA